MPVDASRRSNPVAGNCNRTYHAIPEPNGKRIYNADITRLYATGTAYAPIYNTQAQTLQAQDPERPMYAASHLRALYSPIPMLPKPQRQGKTAFAE